MRNAVICIDLQDEFVLDGQPLTVPGATTIAESASAFAREARELGALVVWTRYVARPGLPYGLTTGRLGFTDVHRGAAAALWRGVDVHSTDIVIDKPRMSAFHGTDLSIVLRAATVDRVLIVGLTTHMCCLATAFDASALDLDTVVVSDLTGCPPYVRDGQQIRSGSELTTLALDLVSYGFGSVLDSRQALQLLAERS